MNAPVPPPVNLANLANLANIGEIAKKRPKSALRLPLTSLLLGAAGVLVWRLAPLEIARRKRAERRSMWIGAGVGVAALAVARWQLQRVFAHEPVHEIELKDGAFEVRRYASVRLAETTVANATWDEALDRGFQRLAGFIFGANDRRERMSMTTPVLGTGDGDGYKVSFVLPEGVAPPAPDDARVAVTDLPARRVAVLRFNGRHDVPTIEAHKRDLTHALALNGLRPRGEASFAGYDPPWTLPLLRRNELWVELEAEATRD